MSLFKPDNNWTLFLDRDGVLNKRKINEYVLNSRELVLEEKVPESLAILKNYFSLLLVVTNQQGIGKGLMSDEDLNSIHEKLVKEIEQGNGRIDKIYYCPALKQENSFMRKPSPGMGLLARKDFPEINFKKSVMVGDTISDMLFGKRLKMITVFIGTNHTLISENYKIIDLAFDSLYEFARYLQNQKR
jgi:histidinol-phosphate phosphatase family protein